MIFSMFLKIKSKFRTPYYKKNNETIRDIRVICAICSSSLF